MPSRHRLRRSCSPQACKTGLLHRADRCAQLGSELSRSRKGARLLHQGGPLPPDGGGQLLGRPRRANDPTMITKVSLEHSCDRGHRKADKRALMRIEAPAGFDQSGARDLQEVFLVLATMQEPARQRLRQPEMRP